jgi:hypothetical protein
MLAASTVWWPSVTNPRVSYSLFISYPIRLPLPKMLPKATAARDLVTPIDLHNQLLRRRLTSFFCGHFCSGRRIQGV